MSRIHSPVCIHSFVDLAHVQHLAPHPSTAKGGRDPTYHSTPTVTMRVSRYSQIELNVIISVVESGWRCAALVLQRFFLREPIRAHPRLRRWYARGGHRCAPDFDRVWKAARHHHRVVGRDRDTAGRRLPFCSRDESGRAGTQIPSLSGSSMLSARAVQCAASANKRVGSSWLVLLFFEGSGQAWPTCQVWPYRPAAFIAFRTLE